MCNYFNTFDIKVEHDLTNLCQHSNTLKLGELLDRLSRLIHNSEKKLEEDNGWTRANTVTSIIASVATIAVSAIATVTTVITYRLTRRPDVTATSLPSSVVNGLRGIMRGLLETTQALGNADLRTGELLTENIAMNNLITEVKSLVSEVSEVVEHSFSYHEGTMIRGNEAIASQLGVGGIGGIGIGVVGLGGQD